MGGRSAEVKQKIVKKKQTESQAKRKAELKPV
jgi:hypothetical protein